MTDRIRSTPTIRGDPRFVLGIVVFCAMLGTLFILGAEALPEDRSTRTGPIGYLLVLVAGWLALDRLATLERVATRFPWVRWAARSTGALLAFDLILYGLVNSGLAGPQIALIALLVVILFVSGGVGIVAMILALFALIPARPRPPMGPAAVTVAIAVVTAVLANTVIGTGLPPESTAAPTGTGAATPSPTPLVTVTPTASPTPTRTLTPPGVALRVNLGGKATGTVRSQPRGIDCRPTCEARFAPDTLVVLTPTPQGSVFAGWAQACSGLGDCQVSMKSSSVVTAFFETPAVGFDADVCGTSASLVMKPGETKTASVCFANKGTTSWTRGTSTEVVLGTCCPLGSVSPMITWRDGWPSDRVYARLPPTNVSPGATVFAPFNVRAPKDALPGNYRFDGMLTLASTGAPVGASAFSILVTVPR